MAADILTHSGACVFFPGIDWSVHPATHLSYGIQDLNISILLLLDGRTVYRRIPHLYAYNFCSQCFVAHQNFTGVYGKSLAYWQIPTLHRRRPNILVEIIFHKPLVQLQPISEAPLFIQRNVLVVLRIIYN